MAAKKALQALPGISLAVVGPKGTGKTTAIARLGQQLGGFAEEQLEEGATLAKELGRPHCGPGWMLDRLLEEREAGLTLEPSVLTFQSGSFTYTALDTPGVASLARSVLASNSLADVAVLVVSAAPGEFEAQLDSGSARELALGCFVMGVKNIIVWVTKLDDTSVQNPATRFEDIKKAVNAFLKEVGYKQKDVPFVPISGLLGENLATRSSDMSWYSGPSAVEALDALGPINRPAEKPLRLPVLEVHDIAGTGTVVVGRVETGSLRPGLKVILSPSGLVSEVRSIHRSGERVTEAKGGDIVGVALSLPASQVRRGMVLSFASNDPAADAESFIAQVVVLDHPGQIRAGYCPAIAVHTAQVPCEFEELLSKTDRKGTGKEAEPNPEFVKTGEVVTVKLRPRAPVCVEAFSAYPSLGRFAVRDHGRTVAVGVVKEVTKRPIPKARTSGENQYFDGS